MNQVNKIVHYSGIGQRSNNEDSYLISTQNFFLVCDGVGGAEKGEIASSLVVSGIQQVMESDITTSPDLALRSAEKKLSEHINNYPESMGMATTLTFSQLRNDGVLIAWVGDSRVYQFRKGKIIFQTIDHSWVNDALRAGMITTEESVNHPKSNIITRAVQGEHKPVEIDIELVNDIMDGDFIFHCSDGVLEAWSNEELEYLFSTQSSAEEIIQLIEQKCSEISRDNNTAILYQLKSDNKPSNNQFINTHEIFAEEVVEAIPMDVNQFQNSAPNQSIESYDTYATSTTSKFKFNKLLFIVTFLVIGIVVFYQLTSTSNNEENPNKKIEKTVKKGNGIKTVIKETKVDGIKVEETDPVKQAEKDGYTTTVSKEDGIENYETKVIKDANGNEVTMYKKKNKEEDLILKAEAEGYIKTAPNQADKDKWEERTVKDKNGKLIKMYKEKESSNKKIDGFLNKKKDPS